MNLSKSENVIQLFSSALIKNLFPWKISRFNLNCHPIWRRIWWPFLPVSFHALKRLERRLGKWLCHLPPFFLLSFSLSLSFFCETDSVLECSEKNLKGTLNLRFDPIQLDCVRVQVVQRCFYGFCFLAG